MVKMKNRILLVAAAFVIIMMLTVSAFAEDGALFLTLNSVEGASGDGEMEVALYRVADRDGESFVLTEDFAHCGVAPEDLCDADASALAAFAEEHASPCGVKYVAIPGDDSFEVTEGVFLVVARVDRADVYEPFCPFLVSIPYTSEGDTEQVYNVMCEPKLELSVHPWADEKEDQETPGAIEASEDDAAPEKLPQTGMIWAPVLIIGLVGILLFALGWSLRFINTDE